MIFYGPNNINIVRELPIYDFCDVRYFVIFFLTEGNEAENILFDSLDDD